MNIWLTSDLHFGHENIIKFCGRPFANVQEMDEALIENYNAVVKPKDTVWILGDVFWRPKIAYALSIWNRLNGSKHVLLGNHDEPRIFRLLNVPVQDTHYLRHDGHRIFLSHYGHRVWRSSHHGSFHAFGHSHGELPPYGRSMDVGVDAIPGYQPIHVDEFISKLSSARETNHHPVRNGTDHADAERWRALLSSPRVRFLGGARIGKPGELLGIEFYDEFPYPIPLENEDAIKFLTEYADRRRGAANGKEEA